MKRLLLALLLFPMLAGAQTAPNIRWDFIAQTTTGVGQMIPMLALPGAQTAFFTGCTTLPCTTPAVTYTGVNSTTACPSNAQVVYQLPYTQTCMATADNQGNFGAWLQPGAYQYTITVSGHVNGPYYFNVGSGGSGGTGSPPQFSIQYYNNALGFGSDPSITINPTTHTTISPTFFAPGNGTAQIIECGVSSQACIDHTVNDNTAAYNWIDPVAAPTPTGTCLQMLPNGKGSWAGCAGINATTYPGADIGEQVNNALNACAQTCEVDVPAGNYNYSTPINAPLNTLSSYRIKLMPGAVLGYQGNSCAVNTTIVGGPNVMNFEISGGTIVGTSTATGGICLQPGNSFHIHDMLILGFSNGYGIWNQGANAGTIETNTIINNNVGVYLTPTYCNGASCAPSPIGADYTPNAVNIVHNVLASNGWGIQYFDSVVATLPGALEVNIDGNDLEQDSIGGAYVGRSHATNVRNNYFEGDPIGLQLGVSAGASFYAVQGAMVEGNFFTVTASMKWDIYLVNTSETIIQGNSQQYGGSETSANCFINGLPYVGATSGGEVNTFVGINHLELGGSGGNYLCENGTGVTALTGAGSYSSINTQYQAYMANQAFSINTAVTSETIALQYLTSNGSCWLAPIAGSSTAINNGRSSILAGTTYLSALTNGQVTMTHPSGSAEQVDVVCINNPTGGFQ